MRLVLMDILEKERRWLHKAEIWAMVRERIGPEFFVRYYQWHAAQKHRRLKTRNPKLLSIEAMVLGGVAWAVSVHIEHMEKSGQIERDWVIDSITNKRSRDWHCRWTGKAFRR